jgi:hypothetical protein
VLQIGNEEHEFIRPSEFRNAVRLATGGSVLNQGWKDVFYKRGRAWVSLVDIKAEHKAELKEQMSQRGKAFSAPPSHPTPPAYFFGPRRAFAMCCCIR